MGWPSISIYSWWDLFILYSTNKISISESFFALMIKYWGILPLQFRLLTTVFILLCIKFKHFISFLNVMPCQDCKSLKGKPYIKVKVNFWERERESVLLWTWISSSSLPKLYLSSTFATNISTGNFNMVRFVTYGHLGL